MVTGKQALLPGKMRKQVFVCTKCQQHYDTLRDAVFCEMSHEYDPIPAIKEFLKRKISVVERIALIEKCIGQWRHEGNRRMKQQPKLKEE